MCLALDGEKSIYANIELERKMRIGYSYRIHFGDEDPHNR